MHCDGIETRLDAYLDGELSTTENATLSAHLDRCSVCREELEARREVRRLFRDRLRASAPAGLQERILTAAAESEGQGEGNRDRGGEGDAVTGRGRTARLGGSGDHRWWRRARWPVALAAAAVLAFAVVLPHLDERESGDGLAAPFTTPARVVVPRYGEAAGQETPARFGGIHLGRTEQRSES